MATWLTILREWWTDQRNPESVAFDRVHGTDTARFDWFSYEPTLPSVMDAALDALDVDVSDHAFVDLGSGKGRAVLIAATRPFREAVGIEHRAALHRAAERNRTRFVGANAPIRFVHADVASAELPEEPLVLYLFNPFGPEVIAKIELEHPDSRLIYVHPVHAGFLDGYTEVARADSPDVIRTWRIYRVVGERARAEE